MSTAEGLRATLKLLDRPERWTQGAHARDATGEKVFSTSPLACRWCVWGALNHAFEDRGAAFWAAVTALTRAASTEGVAALWRWNDTHGRTHAEVINALKRALAEVEGATPSGATGGGGRA